MIKRHNIEIHGQS